MFSVNKGYQTGGKMRDYTRLYREEGKLYFIWLNTNLSQYQLGQNTTPDVKLING